MGLAGTEDTEEDKDSWSNVPDAGGFVGVVFMLSALD